MNSQIVSLLMIVLVVLNSGTIASASELQIIGQAEQLSPKGFYIWATDVTNRLGESVPPQILSKTVIDLNKDEELILVQQTHSQFFYYTNLRIAEIVIFQTDCDSQQSYSSPAKIEIKALIIDDPNRPDLMLKIVNLGALAESKDMVITNCQYLDEIRKSAQSVKVLLATNQDNATRLAGIEKINQKGEMK